MASAKYEGGKCHGGTEVSAHLRHNDIEPENRKRVLAAKQRNGEDCHIDPAKSHLNRTVTGLSYKDAFRRYTDRLAEVDSLSTCTNHRKDRVTMQGIEIPVPEGMPRDKINDFLCNRVPAVLYAMYGRKNFIEGFVHWDEEHEYINAETKEECISRIHGHYDFIPEHNGNLDGKWFSKRSNMVKLNKALDELCQEEYGCSFMTGVKHRSRKTVAELKAESELAAAVKTHEELQEQQRQLDAEQRQIDIQRDALDASRTALEADRAKFVEERDKIMQDVKKWQEEANAALQMARETQQKAEQERAGYEKARRSYEIARDKAAGVVKGFSLDTVDRYGAALQTAVQRRCQAVPCGNGRTLWDVTGRAVQQAVTDAIRMERSNTAPAVMQEQQARAVTARRGLQDLGYSTGAEKGYQPEF